MENLRVHLGGRKNIISDEVILLEADTNYTWIHLKDGSKIFVATTLKTLEARLYPFENFFRFNRTFIANLNYMTEFSRSQHEVSLSNKTTIQISRRRRKDFLSKFIIQKKLK